MSNIIVKKTYETAKRETGGRTTWSMNRSESQETAGKCDRLSGLGGQIFRLTLTWGHSIIASGSGFTMNQNLK